MTGDDRTQQAQTGEWEKSRKVRQCMKKRQLEMECSYTSLCELSICFNQKDMAAETQSLNKVSLRDGLGGN